MHAATCGLQLEYAERKISTRLVEAQENRTKRNETGRNGKGDMTDVEATDQLRRPGERQGPSHARGVRPLRPRRHAAAGEPGGPRSCAGGVLVVRQLVARRVEERRRRSRH